MTRPATAKKTKPKTTYKCFNCGDDYPMQARNFDAVSAPQYHHNNGYLPYCKKCVERDWKELDKNPNFSEEEAMRRLCIKYNIYFNKAIYEGVKSGKGRSEILYRNYLSRLNLQAYKATGKSYEDTLNEEKEDKLRELAGTVKETEDEVSQEIIDLFGTGFTPEEYKFLQKEYKDWTSRYECETKAQEEGFKSLAMCQLTLRDVQSGRNTKVKFTEAMRAFQEMMGTLKIKPVQSKEDNIFGDECAGTICQQWETTRPAPDLDKSLEDVDGLKKIIRVYFLGHLLELFGKKNPNRKEYDEEMAKYTVKPPEFEDNDVLSEDILEEGDVV